MEPQQPPVVADGLPPQTQESDATLNGPNRGGASGPKLPRAKKKSTPAFEMEPSAKAKKKVVVKTSSLVSLTHSGRV